MPFRSQAPRETDVAGNPYTEDCSIVGPGQARGEAPMRPATAKECSGRHLPIARDVLAVTKLW